MKVYFDEIYRHIGYLFYAVASEERVLHTIDYWRLMHLLEHSWDKSPDLANDLQANLVDSLYTGLRDAFVNAMSADDAFRRFSNYFEMHNLPLTADLKARLLGTVHLIASEFSPDSHASGMISKLNELLIRNFQVLSH